MVLAKRFTLWAIFAGLTEFASAARMTLGYRTVSPEQARQYNRNHRLVFDVSRGMGRQLGVGVYTTPGPGDWPGKEGDWHCLITARKSTLRSIPKIWIPEEYWWYSDQLYDWIQSSFPTINMYTALRLSRIHGYEHIEQLMIPQPALSGRGLDLQVVCKENWGDLPDTNRVDYGSWPNVGGTPQLTRLPARRSDLTEERE
ncbi:hypothetical protein LZ30DRAFT_792574 [Colletotrichum cereale]|nr:hypothetical protein LZ30DRAFT_792574 [Colletotrichum cereale]